MYAIYAPNHRNERSKRYFEGVQPTTRRYSTFRASASRMSAEGRARCDDEGVARLQMQTKLFAAGLINVNHRPIVTKLHRKVSYGPPYRSPPPTATKSPRGWLTTTRRLSTPADGWMDGFTFVYPHKATPRTLQFSRSFSPRCPLFVEQIFTPAVSTLRRRTNRSTVTLDATRAVGHRG